MAAALWLGAAGAPALAQDSAAGVAAADAALAAGDLDEATRRYEAISADEAADVEARGRAALGLASLAERRLALGEARAHLTSALERFTRLPRWRAVALYQLGGVLEGSDAEAAQGRWAEAIAAFEVAEDAAADSAATAALRGWRAVVWLRRGALASRQGAHDAAAEHFAQAAELYERLGDEQRQGEALYMQGRELTLGGDGRRAEQALDAAQQAFRNANDKLWVGVTYAAKGLLSARARELEAARFRFGKALEAFDIYVSAHPRVEDARRRLLREHELIAAHGQAMARLALLRDRVSDGDAAPEALAAERAAISDQLDSAWQMARELGARGWDETLEYGALQLAALAGEPQALARLPVVCERFAGDAQMARVHLDCKLLEGQQRHAAGDDAGALEIAREVRAGNEALGDPGLGRAATMLMASVMLRQGVSGDPDVAEEALTEALGAIPGDDLATRAALLEGLAKLAAGRGRLDDAHDRYEEAARLHRQADDAGAQARVLMADARLYLGLGEREAREAEDLFEDAERLYLRLEDASGERRARLGLAEALQARGKLRDALRQARWVVSSAQEAAATDQLGEAQLMLARLLLADEEEEDAIEAARAAIATLGESPAALDAQVILADLLLRTDDAAGAGEAIAAARGLLTDLASPSAARLALLGAEVDRRRDAHDEAAAGFEEASARFKALGDLEGQGDAQVGLGRVLAARGEPREAIKRFREAEDLYEEVGNSALRKRGYARALRKTLED